MLLSIEMIRTDGGTQPRAALREDWIEEYKEDLLANAVFPPIVVFFDGAEYWLADGFHRTGAVRKAGRTEIEADTRQGSRRDAVLYSVSDNGQHGHRRTNDDKRRAIEVLLNDLEWSRWSDREIARQCDVDHKTVSARRADRASIWGNSPDTRLATRGGATYEMRTDGINRARPLDFGAQPEVEEGIEPLPFRPRTEEHPFTCETFGKGSGVEVWHCVICTRHWTMNEDSCPNCHIGMRPGAVAYGDPEPVVQEPPTVHNQQAQETDENEWYSPSAYIDPSRYVHSEPEPVVQEPPTVHNHRAQGTGENEWYTPSSHIDAARYVLGEIDLDPASSEIANQTVGAAKFFGLDDDGLAQTWNGRVWMNPPYAQPWIARFTEKLVAEYAAGNVSEAIALTHNYTDTAWFHHAAGACDAICFTRGRIGFVNPAGERAAPTQGQAFFYFGDNIERFAEAFSRTGFVVYPTRR